MARGNHFVQKRERKPLFRKSEVLERWMDTASRFLREGLGILFFFFSLFLGLILYSHRSSDPSFNHAGTQEVTNMGGLVGSHLSDLLFQLVGLAAWWLPPLLFITSLRLFRNRPLELFWDQVLALPMLLVATSLMASLFPVRFPELAAGAGGLIGAWSVPALIRFFGQWGSLLLLAPLALLSLMILLRFSLISFLDREPVAEEEGDPLPPLHYRLWHRVVQLIVRLRERQRRNRERHLPFHREPHLTLDERAEPLLDEEPLLPLPPTGPLTPPPVVAREELPPPVEAVVVATPPPAPESAPMVAATTSAAMAAEVVKPSPAELLDPWDEEWEPDEPLFDEEEKSAPPPPPVAVAPVAVAPVTPASRPTPAPALPEEEGIPVDPLPPMALLSRPEGNAGAAPSADSMEQRSRMLERILSDFGVEGRIVHAQPGPVVTTFELEPAPGIKSSKVIGLAEDLARSLSTTSVRVVGNIPGKSVIGIEIPNDRRVTVHLREILETPAFAPGTPPLTVALGSDITGRPVVSNLAKMPHLLIAGTTGSGKSVAVNAMICTILFRATPEQVRMLMVDPKMLELSIYEGIPHLLSPVVTDVRKAANLLKWAVGEMEDRYRLLSEVGVRNLDSFNQRMAEAREKGEIITRRVKTGFDPETGRPIEQEEPIPLDPLPLILIIVDELADLMMVVGKEVEPPIARLAQMARAAGIHLVLATQRPSVDVITGLIKANFPTRLSFKVSSRVDSRTILDTQGAESLLGMGDALFLPPGTSQLLRLHAPFVADGEIHKLVSHLKRMGPPRYNDAILADRGEEGGDEGEGGMGEGEEDPLYDQAAGLVHRTRKASASMVQRHFKIGYNRAARLIEQMEKSGLVSGPNSAGKREVLLPAREE